MMDAGKRYNNCLLDRIGWVHGGQQYYYEFEGEPGMIVELERDAPYGWKVDTVRLAKNRRPSRGDLRRLAEELAGTEVFFCLAGHKVDDEDADFIPVRRRRRR